MGELRRLATWGLAAAAALVIAAFVATSDSGEDRLAQLKTKLDGAIQARNNPTRQDAEIRKLTETLQTLAADRDRLAGRLDTLERSVSEYTGSVGRTTATNPPPPIPAAPTPVAAPPELAPAAPQSPFATPEPGRPEFGIDLGGAANLEGLRTLWATAKVRHSGLLDGMRPVVSIRENSRAGGIELRLVIGPIGNAAAAARLCSVIVAAGALCQPAMFDGQRLASR